MLNSGQRRHLVSIYATATHYLHLMEDAAAAGRSPSGVGSTLTPLNPESADPILGPVRELRTRLRAIAEELAPRELSELESPQPPAQTLLWMSNLLQRLRSCAESVGPRRVTRYGDLSEDIAETLAATQRELQALVAEADQALQEAVARGPRAGT